MPKSLLFASAALAASLAFTAPSTIAQTAPQAQRAVETPLSMVNALHTAFGDHHDRAVHTKGVMLEGSFMPSPEARTLTIAPIFAAGRRPLVARFSLFAGVPDLPDTDDGASPAGFAFKINATDGNDFDVE